ncbi:hypothetical protein Kisp02_47320 [Kineosporia sp. NBRC 101731]|nr:hypothetical protein Kisp02_47320 [Kineosporia sp. NBRC 101731]
MQCRLDARIVGFALASFEDALDGPESVVGDLHPPRCLGVPDAGDDLAILDLRANVFPGVAYRLAFVVRLRDPTTT